MVSVKIMFKYVDGNAIWATSGQVDIDFWELFIDIVLLSLTNIVSDFDFNSFQKKNINLLGGKFDLDVK